MKPSASLALAALTALASLAITLTGRTDEAAMALGFIPARLGTETMWAALPVWLTPLSATLVHDGVWHLAMNLLLLVWCGREVERIIGPASLVLLYLVGAVFAAAGQYAVDPQSVTPMIGASGAISALVGAYALSFGKAKAIVGHWRLNRWLNIAWILAAWVVLQMMTAYLMGLHGVLLATGAHVGGFIAGLLLQKPLLLWRYRGA